MSATIKHQRTVAGITTKSQLNKHLRRAGINTEHWGTSARPETVDTETLFRNITSGHCELKTCGKKTVLSCLMFRIQVVSKRDGKPVRLYNTNAGKDSGWIVVERKRADLSERTVISVTENLLGISVQPKQIAPLPRHDEERVSVRFPGINESVRAICYEVSIPEEDMNPDGYTGPVSRDVRYIWKSTN